MKKYSLSFHQTFSPEIAYLSKLLIHSEEIVGFNKDQISQLTGIPTGSRSGKIDPHIEYLKFMDLIKKDESKSKYAFKVTDLGKIILSEDRYMSERVTKLILNYFLTSKMYGADMWNYILRELPYIYGSTISTALVSSEVASRYNKSVRLGAFNSTYISEKSFRDLDILQIEDENYNFKGITFSYDEIYVYCYTLVKELEKIDSCRKEFTYTEIFQNIKWNLGFQWSVEYAIDVLEKLEMKGLVQLNKQINPITIIVKQSSSELERQLYSLLF